MALVAVALTALNILAGTAAPPLAVACSPAVAREVCRETIDAARARGLPPVHPLILGARVEPGAASGEGELGHRATVTFDLLGVPGTTDVRLYFDIGAHWGGRADRGAIELALWSALPGTLAALLVGWLVRVRTRWTPGAS